MATVASLRPENAAEGRLAAQFVAAEAWALDCLRLAKDKRRDIEVAYRCRAQAMSMMREAKSSLRLLLRLQAARQKVEADAAAAERAAWAEHASAGMMAEALAAAPAARRAAASGQRRRPGRRGARRRRTGQTGTGRTGTGRTGLWARPGSSQEAG